METGIYRSAFNRCPCSWWLYAVSGGDVPGVGVAMLRKIMSYLFIPTPRLKIEIKSVKTSPPPDIEAENIMRARGERMFPTDLPQRIDAIGDRFGFEVRD